MGNTYIYNGNQQIASFDGILPATLFEGMIFRIHGYENVFQVRGWEFQIGHPDEKPGLHIQMQEVEVIKNTMPRFA